MPDRIIPKQDHPNYGHLINEMNSKKEYDEYDEKEEAEWHELPLGTSPIKLEGFSRYEIYPDGKVIDCLKGWRVPINRHLNFLMYPDVEVLDDKGKPKPVIENLRSLIKDLVAQRIPGFTRELPAYQAPDFFEVLKPKQGVRVPLHEQKSKELHFLRKTLAICTEKLLKKIETKEDKEQAQNDYINAKANLDLFKENNPDYYKWAPYAEYQQQGSPEEVQELLAEEKRLREALEEVDARIKQLRKDLAGTGVLYLFGYKDLPKFGL